jgi:hypothetical protein
MESSSIIDIYEFKLEGYGVEVRPNLNLKYYKFNLPFESNKDLSNPDECGIIKSKNTDPTFVNNAADIRSCDLIKSNIINTTEDDDLFDYIINYPTINNEDSPYYIDRDVKELITNTYTYKFSKLKKYFDNIYANCNPKFNLKDLSIHEFCKPPDNFLLNYLELLKVSIDTLDHVYQFNPTPENPSYIYELYVEAHHKIICIGDIHGGFHTFYRLLKRFELMGVLDLETFTINEPYKIIFTGDILDRGVYSLEILDILLKFIIINTTRESIKIIYNRGNHEDYTIFSRDGFKDELKIKFAKLTDPIYFTDLIINIQTFLTKLPCAIVMKCASVNKSYYISHGGFSIQKDNIIDGKYFEPDNYEFMLNKCYLTEQQTTQIMWNDFTSIPTNFISKSYKSVRGSDDMFNLSKLETDKFLEQNGINFIIRAHQDSYGNSFLFAQSIAQIDVKLTIRDNIAMLNNYLETNTITKFGSKTKPIARLNINKLTPADKIFRVLTISTNTAYNRNLHYDSFILINFN